MPPTHTEHATSVLRHTSVNPEATLAGRPYPLPVGLVMDSVAVIYSA